MVKSSKLWYNIIIMNVIKSCTKLKKMTKQDDYFMNASPQERIASIWELTAELYSLKNKNR